MQRQQTPEKQIRSFIEARAEANNSAPLTTEEAITLSSAIHLLFAEWGAIVNDSSNEATSKKEHYERVYYRILKFLFYEERYYNAVYKTIKEMQQEFQEEGEEAFLRFYQIIATVWGIEFYNISSIQNDERKEWLARFTQWIRQPIAIVSSADVDLAQSQKEAPPSSPVETTNAADVSTDRDTSKEKASEVSPDVRAEAEERIAKAKEKANADSNRMKEQAAMEAQIAAVNAEFEAFTAKIEAERTAKQDSNAATTIIQNILDFIHTHSEVKTSASSADLNQLRELAHRLLDIWTANTTIRANITVSQFMEDETPQGQIKREILKYCVKVLSFLYPADAETLIKEIQAHAFTERDLLGLLTVAIDTGLPKLKEVSEEENDIDPNIIEITKDIESETKQSSELPHISYDIAFNENVELQTKKSIEYFINKYEYHLVKKDPVAFESALASFIEDINILLNLWRRQPVLALAEPENIALCNQLLEFFYRQPIDVILGNATSSKDKLPIVKMEDGHYQYQGSLAGNSQALAGLQAIMNSLEKGIEHYYLLPESEKEVVEEAEAREIEEVQVDIDKDLELLFEKTEPFFETYKDKSPADRSALKREFLKQFSDVDTKNAAIDLLNKLEKESGISSDGLLEEMLEEIYSDEKKNANTADTALFSRHLQKIANQEQKENEVAASSNMQEIPILQQLAQREIERERLEKEAAQREANAKEKEKEKAPAIRSNSSGEFGQQAASSDSPRTGTTAAVTPPTDRSSNSSEVELQEIPMSGDQEDFPSHLLNGDASESTTLPDNASRVIEWLEWYKASVTADKTIAENNKPHYTKWANLYIKALEQAKEETVASITEQHIKKNKSNLTDDFKAQLTLSSLSNEMLLHRILSEKNATEKEALLTEAKARLFLDNNHLERILLDDVAPKEQTVVTITPVDKNDDVDVRIAKIQFNNQESRYQSIIDGIYNDLNGRITNLNSAYSLYDKHLKDENIIDRVFSSIKIDSVKTLHESKNEALTELENAKLKPETVAVRALDEDASLQKMNAIQSMRDSLKKTHEVNIEVMKRHYTHPFVRTLHTIFAGLFLTLAPQNLALMVYGLFKTASTEGGVVNSLKGALKATHIGETISTSKKLKGTSLFTEPESRVVHHAVEKSKEGLGLVPPTPKKKV